MNSPLAIGFIQGIKFDTLKSIVPDFDSLAARYQTTSRTVRRWHASGADVEDAAAVALYLASIQHPGPAALAAVESLLQTELQSLNS